MFLKVYHQTKIARANLKNSELDKILGIPPTSDFLADPNWDEQGVEAVDTEHVSDEELHNVQPKKLSFDFKVVKSPSSAQQTEDEKEKFIADVAASLEHESDVF